MKCNSALAQIREMNKNHLTNLLGRVRKDYCQQIIKNKIENINNEVYQFYDVIFVYCCIKIVIL